MKMREDISQLERKLEKYIKKSEILEELSKVKTGVLEKFYKKFKGQAITKSGKKDIKDGEIFITLDTPNVPNKEDKEAVILQAMKYVDGVLEKGDRYEIKSELGKLYEYVQSANPMADEVFIREIKLIGKKIINKEIQFSKKEQESKIKTGKILTRADKLKFLKSL